MMMMMLMMMMRVNCNHQPGCAGVDVETQCSIEEYWGTLN
jgi:hypothetical protein